MFLHIGRDRIVRTDDIIGIFDIETTSTSKISREYLAPSRDKEIVSVTQELPKSFIVCSGRGRRGPDAESGLKDGGIVKNNREESPPKSAGPESPETGARSRTRVYISQISSGTLLKRLRSAQSPSDLLGEKGLAED